MQRIFLLLHNITECCSYRFNTIYCHYFLHELHKMLNDIETSKIRLRNLKIELKSVRFYHILGGKTEWQYQCID